MKEKLIQRILNGYSSKDHGLSADFILTNLTQMKGCGCKVPQAVGFSVRIHLVIFVFFSCSGGL